MWQLLLNHQSSLTKLREHGLNGYIQGSMEIKGKLRDYIMSFFEHGMMIGFYPEKVRKEKANKS